jgi:hypothetical protein
MRQQEAMKTSITWSPAAGLNVVSVEWREQAEGIRTNDPYVGNVAVLLDPWFFGTLF